MAKDKKSFVLYVDQKGVFDKLNNEQAGILIKHIFKYVNDENPESDFVTELAFESIKNQLKRDLKKFEEVRKKRSQAGKRSAELRALNKSKQNLTKSTSVEFVKECSTNPTDNVNVNDIIDKSINNKDLYIKETFLKDWNKTRSKILGIPSNFNRLKLHDKTNLKDICKYYDRETIINAMIALFKQENAFDIIKINPTHFLENFETFKEAYNTKNKKIFKN